MIGFAAIKRFEGFGFKIEAAIAPVQANAHAIEENREDESAKRELETALNRVEANVPPGEALANVTQTVAEGHTIGSSDRAIKWANISVAKAFSSPTARVILDPAKAPIVEKFIDTLPLDYQALVKQTVLSVIKKIMVPSTLKQSALADLGAQLKSVKG